MNKNDILRRIRYIFDLSDSEMISIFDQADYTVTRAQISSWLKKDDAPDYQKCTDRQLAAFLNGLINEKRGKRDSPQIAAEKTLTNNMIFMKLKIALSLRTDDILKFLSLADVTISEHELSAFFRRESHKHYRECKNQMLRRFLKGLQLHHRPPREPFVENPWDAIKLPGEI